MNIDDIKTTPEGERGHQYRSMHDARPTAPTGTVWYVSNVDKVMGTVYLYATNGWGRHITATCTAAQLHDDLKPKETTTK